MGKEIGIDLGTTNTIVSYVNKKGRLRSLRYESQTVIPSVIYFLTKDEFVIGEIAKKRYLERPQSGVANFKSLMGEKKKIEITADNGETFLCSAKKVASLFLNAIITNLENRLIKEFGPVEGCIGNVVITVPAKFNESEKEATKWAAREAGFEEVKLVAEPTAAAVAHKQESGQEGKSILVYDFGGGTFDVSVIQEERDRFVEIATGGDKHLGGNKLTDRLAEYFFKRIEEDYGIELPFEEEDFDEEYCEMSKITYFKNRTAIWEEVDLAKKALSDETEYKASINLILPDSYPEDKRIAVWDGCKITREKLESFIRKDLEHTIQITANVIQEAKEEGVEQIDKIVLAGGSSQIPLVKQMMEEHFSKNHPIYADDISTLISRGAALLANEELESMTEALTNIQYGIATTDGASYRMFRTIIPENQKLPCSGKEYFYLNKDGQNRIEIPYYERDIKNYPHAVRTDEDGITEIDTIVISHLPEGLKKDEVKIGVEFIVQIDGTLGIKIEVLDKEGKVLQNMGADYEKASNLE